jgi:hypothetical protein
MINSRFAAIAGGLAIAASAFVLSGCTGAAPIGGNTLPPITVDANDLQGKTVEINSKQPLNINTGDLAVDSYSLVSATPEGVVEFVAGHSDGSATYNPGFTAVKEGTTEVVLENTDGGIQDLTFTITVVAAP